MITTRLDYLSPHLQRTYQLIQHSVLQTELCRFMHWINGLPMTLKNQMLTLVDGIEPTSGILIYMEGRNEKVNTNRKLKAEI